MTLEEEFRSQYKPDGRPPKEAFIDFLKAKIEWQNRIIKKYIKANIKHIKQG